jgi:hypothetical protein
MHPPMELPFVRKKPSPSSSIMLLIADKVPVSLIGGGGAPIAIRVPLYTAVMDRTAVPDIGLGTVLMAGATGTEDFST